LPLCKALAERSTSRKLQLRGSTVIVAPDLARNGPRSDVTAHLIVGMIM
jgi:hypothetical protein